ncbi:enoyl-CoA hydratase/isomerase family protein [Rhodococcus erythropolis]|uniref:enoyl-CoA hydratase/isomerase family protein n=1 Tax=Rhodococcus erythropolis TaxID=1833 RepID=UPI0022260369|nr:enoyl-CoA hydratase/isomerase family protein [Rhodococcus erythropolis]MCW2295425.1 enoyl-CoA hydratase [Rhodococcus erythropolis]
MTDDSKLLIDDRDGVRWLTFNRPAIHNAQDPEMLELLDAALDDIARKRDCRAVVLAGVGKSFTSGHDLRQMHDNHTFAHNASSVEGRFWQEFRLFVEPVRKFRELSVPTVCRIQGHCLAAGLMFAASADFVVADTTAKFGSPIVTSIAVNDAEVASFALRVGESVAKRVFWLDERLDAQQAYDAGLVTWVVQPDELDTKTNEVANKLASAPAETIALSKQSLLFMADQRGEREINKFHFMAHQLSHWTSESQAVLDARLARLAGGGKPFDESAVPAGSASK